MNPPLPPQQEKYLLLTLAGIQFSHVLDFMIMMPLGPILIAEFGITTHAFGLLVAVYSFSAAASGFLGTTFVDRFERRNLLLGMFVLFGLATLACGLAPVPRLGRYQRGNRSDGPGPVRLRGQRGARSIAGAAARLPVADLGVARTDGGHVRCRQRRCAGRCRSTSRTRRAACGS